MPLLRNAVQLFVSGMGLVQGLIHLELKDQNEQLRPNCTVWTIRDLNLSDQV